MAPPQCISILVVWTGLPGVCSLGTHTGLELEQAGSKQVGAGPQS